MKHFINIEDIPLKDLKKILIDAKKRKQRRLKLATLEKSLKEQETKLKESTAEKVSVAVNTEEPKEPENKVQANLMEDMNSLLDTTV